MNAKYDRELGTMAAIQAEKAKEVVTEQQALDEEGRVLAEGKRFTFDVVDTPVDPLR